MCRLVVALLLLSALVAKAQQPALIGYYAGDGRNLEEHRIDQLTHLIWCFGHLRNDSMVIADAQVPVLERMVAFKKDHPALKILISLGGWGGCAPCSEVFGRREGRSAFAASVLRLMERYRVDGIDLDWEYPAVQGPPGHSFSPEDRHNFTLLVQELRRVLGTGYEISFAAGGTDECLVKGFEWRPVMAAVDRVHVMSYDLVHGYSTTTGHHTPLYSSTMQEGSVDHAVRLLDSLKVPREQVVIGAAFYARFWKDVPAMDNGLFQPGIFSHTIPFSAEDTTITEAMGWRLFRDKEAWAAYAYNPGAELYATYDDRASVTAKANYVVRERLGGIMFWQLHDDRPQDGLLRILYEALRSP